MDNKDYRKESDRVESLKTWPCKFLSEFIASSNGLYYNGIGDCLVCIFCNVELKDWKCGDDIEERHKTESPFCHFLLNKPVGNVPMSRDEGGKIDTKDYKPAHTMYRTKKSRLETYKYWPIAMVQRPEELAEAGFYYGGSGDQTICFYCGGGLKDWEPEDIPWEQHALWLKNCLYLIKYKSNDFIEQVNEKYKLANQSRASTDRTDPTEICTSCREKPRNVCFIPCGHVVVCSLCALMMTHCPICRSRYTSLVKIANVR